VRPIRVLHLVSTFEVKTDTKWLALLMRHLDRQRCQAAIACMYGGGPMRGVFQSLGVETANLESPGELDLRAILRAYQYIRSGRFDVVHTHLLRADLYGGLAARLVRGPGVVSTVYAIGAYRRERRRRLDGLLDQLTRLWPNDVVAVCRAVRNDVVRRLRWPRSRVSVIHTGIEPADYRRDEIQGYRVRCEWGMGRARPLMVTVARLSYEKGLPTLLEAVRQLGGRCPDLACVIVGDGPMREALARRIEAAGLGDRVRLVGFRNDIPAVLAAADLFCLPSRMEGLPNVLLEAGAAGVPVVATRVGGVPEVVVDGRTGILVPPGRPEAMADAIDRLIREPALARRLADAGRKRVERRFSAEVATRKYQMLYESIAARRRGIE